MASFRFITDALEYEIKRQSEILDSGGETTQETRLYDEAKRVTLPMRSKEDAPDYRYFPDPDLMPFVPEPDWLAEVRNRVAELPLARKQRFQRDYHLPSADAQTFVDDVPLGDYFESIAPQAKNPKAVANWVINNLRAKLSESCSSLTSLKFHKSGILELVDLVENGTISSRTAQDVFAQMLIPECDLCFAQCGTYIFPSPHSGQLLKKHELENNLQRQWSGHYMS